MLGMGGRLRPLRFSRNAKAAASKTIAAVLRKPPRPCPCHSFSLSASGLRQTRLASFFAPEETWSLAWWPFVQSNIRKKG